MEALVKCLNSLPMVRWDRWVKRPRLAVVYGWIAREDGRSDFVVIYHDYTKCVGSVTSSALWTEEIHRILFAGSEPSVHTSCQRVESTLAGVENVCHAGG